MFQHGISDCSGRKLLLGEATSESIQQILEYPKEAGEEIFAGFVVPAVPLIQHLWMYHWLLCISVTFQ